MTFLNASDVFVDRNVRSALLPQYNNQSFRPAYLLCRCSLGYRWCARTFDRIPQSYSSEREAEDVGAGTERREELS